MAGVRLASLLNEALRELSATPDVLAVSIRALLPNPEGQDPGNERVTLFNAEAQVVALSGWKLVDRAGNVFELAGQITPTRGLLMPITDKTTDSADNSVIKDWSFWWTSFRRSRPRKYPCLRRDTT